MEKNVLFITKDSLGSGSEELGRILLKSFIATLIENNNFSEIILVNSGVKLACFGANTVDDLASLSNYSNILLCQTCLNYYDLDDKVAVGQKSNMTEILAYLTNSTKVVTI